MNQLGFALLAWHQFPARIGRPSMNLAAYPRSWKSRPRNGKLVATIGPLPITAGRSYSALYMEASMRPGMKSAIHRHSGPEAWYTLSGETCLETPNGSMVGRAGGPPVIVPGGGPMELTATGTGRGCDIAGSSSSASPMITAGAGRW